MLVDYDGSISLSVPSASVSHKCHSLLVNLVWHTHTGMHMVTWDMIICRCRLTEGITHWLDLERLTRGWKVAGPCRSGGRIFFSRVNFMCRLLVLFWYPFHPCVSTVAHKRSQSFCQKCRWQVTAEHACIYIYIYINTCGFAWSDVVHGCMVYTYRMCRHCGFEKVEGMKENYLFPFPQAKRSLWAWLCMKRQGAWLYGVPRTLWWTQLSLWFWKSKSK